MKCPRILVLTLAVLAVIIAPAVPPASPRASTSRSSRAWRGATWDRFRTGAWTTAIAVPEAPPRRTSTRSSRHAERRRVERRRITARHSSRSSTASRRCRSGRSSGPSDEGIVWSGPAGVPGPQFVLRRRRLQVRRRREDLGQRGPARLASHLAHPRSSEEPGSGLRGGDGPSLYAPMPSAGCS